MIHWVSKYDDSKYVKENSVVTLTKHQPVQLVLLNDVCTSSCAELFQSPPHLSVSVYSNLPPRLLSFNSEMTMLTFCLQTYELHEAIFMCLLNCSNFAPEYKILSEFVFFACFFHLRPIKSLETTLALKTPDICNELFSPVLFVAPLTD